MKFIKFPINFLLLVFLLGSFFSNTFAQCDGVFFKTVNREIYASSPFANFAAEYTPTLSNQKDVTGDGKIDLIGGGILRNQIYIAPNEGNGNFGALTLIPLPSGAIFYVEDFTGDGLNDFLVQLGTTLPEYRVYRNNGNLSFTPLAPTALTNGFETVRNVVDINNDNRADILLDNNYRLANADGTFAARVTVLNSPDFNFPIDFDNNGFIDFAQARDSFSLRIAYNNGNGNFTISPVLTNIGTNAAILAVADFNNDSKPDILARNNSQAFFYISRPDTGYIESAYPVNSITSRIFSVADYTGDGFADVLIKSAPETNSPMNPTKPATLLTNNGAGVFTTSNTEAPVRGFTIGDLDNDNKADFLLFNNNTIGGTINGGMFLGENQVHFQKNVCQKPAKTKIVDFDGDNIPDKSFFRPSDGRWRIKKSSDNSIISLNWGLNGDIAQPGDYDGDGKTDVAVFRPSNGTWYIINSSNGSFTIIKFGIGEDKPVSSDFNGDGQTDIAVFRPSDGNWYIYFLESGNYAITHFGIAEDKPVQEDYDGDGKTDIAVYRPSTGIWYYLKSSDGNFEALRWGISSDIPAPADYDGDGKADLNIFRPSESKWYVLKSSNPQYFSFGFGTAEDIPQISDWDGNGTFDLSIYRPTTKLWYSTLNNNSEVFGETGEIPISSIVRTE